MRTPLRILRVLATAAAALSTLLLLLLAVAPHTGTYRTITVLTGSMRPGMAPGSVVVVRPIDPRDIRVGDVLTFHAPTDAAEVVTHRVVEVIDPGPAPAVRTQGDANASPDPWVARIDRAPAWRVVATVPGLGLMLRALRSPVVTTIAVRVVPLVLLAALLRDVWRPRNAATATGGAAR